MAGRSTVTALTRATDPRLTGATGNQDKPRDANAVPPEDRGQVRSA